MSLLTDIDIKRALDRDIVIEPFDSESLSPIGYDLRVGDFVFSLERGLLVLEGDGYKLPPRNTIQILTRESIWVSSRIAGTLHSRVSLVSKGLSHISTTLDPGWYGPLLITIRNNTDNSIHIARNSGFATLIFYRVRTPTRMIQRRFAFVQKILVEQHLQAGTNAYIERVSELIGEPDAGEIFRKRVEEANVRALGRVLKSLRRLQWRAVSHFICFAFIWLAILLLSSLSYWWDSIRWLFNDIGYDSKMFAAQIAGIIGLFAVNVSLSRRQQ